MNKKISKIFIFLIFLPINHQIFAQQIGNNAVQIIESTNTHIAVQVKIDSIHVSEKIVDQNSYHLVSISGFNFMTEPGKPQLPATGLLLAIPPTGSVNLQIIGSQITSRSGLTILPFAEQILDENSQGEPQFIIDDKWDTWYPQELVRIGETGFIRNQRVVQVQIYPVQYNPAQKMLRIYNLLTFKLNFENGTAQNPPGFADPTFESVIQKILPNYETGKSWRKPKSSSVALQKSDLGTVNASSYKIYVKEDGIYRLTESDLKGAGIIVAEIDPRTIKILNRGKELPIYVQGEKDGRFDEGDYIEFYGQFNRGENSYLSPYSISNVFWLSWGGTKGLRLAEVDAGLYEKDSTKFVSPNSYRFTKHVEDDKIFDRLLLVTDELKDHWFWETMNANRTYEFKFNLQHPIRDASSARVKVMMHGSTHPSVNPDHHTIVKLNGFMIEDATWDGQVEYYIEKINVPNNVLKDGENTLTVELPGDTQAGEVDQVFFNWFEISYWRDFQAIDDFIEIQVQESEKLHQFEINGLSEKDIFIIDNLGRRLVNFEVIKKDSSFTAIFQDVSHKSSTTYYVLTPNAIKKPEKIVEEIPSNLKSSQNSADYILLTHDQFRQAITLLADHRTAQGLRVKIVDIQDIYDEFSHGIFDPAAIHRFLKYSYENWTPPAPLYVLLVGDATWAYDKQVARNWGKTCYIPTVMKYTISWGLTSSDNAFVCVSGDDRLPDMFIGRLPINSIEEAQIVIDKILQYEQQPTISDWRKRICLACGNGSFFEQSADYLYNEYIPKGFDVPRIYTNPRSKYFGSTEEMVEIFNNGVALLNFIGHGGGGVFFDAELFLLEDIVLLSNASKLPVMFSLTCFIGYFDNPWTPSLGEELFRAKGKGVIATFGSAGRAWLYGDYFLNNALFQSLFKNNQLNLGQVTTEAKWQMVAWSSSYWDHVENYNLLGDPALQVGFPEEEISMEITNPSLKTAEALTVQGRIPDIPSGQVKLSVFDVNDSLVAKTSQPVTNGNFQAQIQLPQNNKAGQGILKAYGWNDHEDAIGAAYFSIEAPCFTNVFTEPYEPGHLDSTYITADIQVSPAIAPQGIDSAFCQWSTNQHSWNEIPMNLTTVNQYSTNHPIVVSEGTTVHYKIQAFYLTQSDSSSVSLESPVHSFSVKKRADLFVVPPGIAIYGQDQVFIQIVLKNNGETNAENFKVAIFDGEPESGGIPIGERINLNQLKAKADTIVATVWAGDPQGAHSLIFQIDPENQIDEFNEDNNIFRKQIQLLTLKHGSSGTVASQDSNFSVIIPLYAVTSNTCFVIRTKTNEDINQSYPVPQSFSLTTLANGSQSCYQIEIENEAIELVKPFSVSFLSPISIAEHQPKVYAWDNQTSQWSYRTSQLDSSKKQISTEVNPDDFLFGLFTVEDAIPPKISVKIDGQNFADGDFVSSNPSLSIVLEDNSGIDIQSYPPAITLNDRLVDQNEFVFTKSPNSPNIVLMNYFPTLSLGEHELKIKAMDVAGNWEHAALNLKVSGEFELLSIANHPNPFVDKTIIAYTLTDEAREVKIKIYTASGRLIKTFDFINEVGYIEHVWDGCDEFGDEVANGIYYLKFVAVSGKKRIERVEKMAKIR